MIVGRFLLAKVKERFNIQVIAGVVFVIIGPDSAINEPWIVMINVWQANESLFRGRC